MKVSVSVLMIVMILVLPMSAVVVTSQGSEPDNLPFPANSMVIENLALTHPLRRETHNPTAGLARSEERLILGILA